MGQELPLVEVPAPNSRKAGAVQRDLIQLCFFRLCRENREIPPRVSLEDLKKHTLLSEHILKYVCEQTIFRSSA